MKNTNLIAITITMLAALGLVVLGTCIQRHIQRAPAPVNQMKPDTIYVHDTILFPDPVPVTVYVDRVVPESKEETDIVDQGDSLLIPIVTKVYENEHYKAVVEGYLPKLKELQIYSESMQITKPVMYQTSRWGIGVTAGVAVTQDGVKPAVTLGVTYNFKNFRTKLR